MSKRIVFGRRWFTVNGQDIKVELRERGVFVRLRNRRTVWWITPAELFALCKHQLELFDEQMVKGNQGAPMPGVQKGLVVPPGAESRPVHESSKPAPEAPQVGGNGLDTLVERAVKAVEADAKRAKEWHSELQKPDGSVAGTDSSAGGQSAGG